MAAVAAILRTAVMHHLSLMGAASAIEDETGQPVNMRDVITAIKARDVAWDEIGTCAGDYWKVCAEAANRMEKR